jgi:hypothetical protein
MGEYTQTPSTTSVPWKRVDISQPQACSHANNYRAQAKDRTSLAGMGLVSRFSYRQGQTLVDIPHLILSLASLRQPDIGPNMIDRTVS